MNCPDCNNEMEQVDTTYSNYTSERAYEGQHTGNIYFCESCATHFIDCFLTGELMGWSYDL